MERARRRRIATLLFAAVCVAVFLYASGALRSGRVAPGTTAIEAVVPEPAATVTAERARVAATETAVGTVRSRRRVDVAAQVTGRVEAVAARAGERVRAGTEIVVLDDREARTALAQAQQTLEASEAAVRRADQALVQVRARLDQVSARRDRVRALAERAAATSEEVEAAEADYLTARAAVADADAAIAAAAAARERAREGVGGAEVALGHTRVLAPIDGVVSERLVEPGDLAWPGRTLLVVLDPSALRLEAQVREGLIARVHVGDRLVVSLPAAARSADGVVAEILPTADPLSRTFEVRVDLADAPGVLPGMFGRVGIPVGEREVVRLPETAVARIGQLSMVVVRQDGRWRRRLVTLGESFDDGVVEVLSGLAGGEVVGTPGTAR